MKIDGYMIAELANKRGIDFVLAMNYVPDVLKSDLVFCKNHYRMDYFKLTYEPVKNRFYVKISLYHYLAEQTTIPLFINRVGNTNVV